MKNKNLITVLTLVLFITLTACEKSESSDSPKSKAKIEERSYKTPEQDSADMVSYRNLLSIEFPRSLDEQIKFMVNDIKKRDPIPDTITGGLVSWNYSRMYGIMNYCEDNNGKPFNLSITYYGYGDGYVFIDDMGADSFSGVNSSEIFSSPENRWSPNRPPYTKEEVVIANERYKEILLKVYAEFNYPKIL